MIAVLVAVALLGAVAVILVWALCRSSSLADRDAELAAQRIAAIRALPTPDELPRSPDLTQGQRRAFRGRQHPISRKRSGRGI